MATIDQSELIRVRIPSKHGPQDESVLIFRQPTDEEFRQYRRRSLPRPGLKEQDRFMAARDWLFTLLLIDVENTIYRVNPGQEPAQYAPLTSAVEGWKGRIPYRWKERAIGEIELLDTLSEEEEKNSDGPSAI